jgi:hypothetical protein
MEFAINGGNHKIHGPAWVGILLIVVIGGVAIYGLLGLWRQEHRKRK